MTDQPSNTMDGEPGQNEQVASPAAGLAVGDSQPLKLVPLPKGNSLTAVDALSITRARHTRLVVLAGDVESGKTTILASLYQAFTERPFAGYLFASSATLVDLERICHDSRFASQRDTPNTERTKYGDSIPLLHLAVRTEHRTRPAQDILFTDASGELFDAIRNSAEECARHPILRRADHICLLADGAKICDPLLRHGVEHGVTQLLRRFVESGTIGAHSSVHLLFTKWDLILASANADSNVMPFVQQMSDQIVDQFGDSVSNLRIHQVAARPEPRLGTGLEQAHGLEALLKLWVEKAPSRTTVPETLDDVPPYREIDRYRAIPLASIAGVSK